MVARLFDEGERTDPAPARPGEGSYAFLNRVDRPYWGRVRDELETWYREYPGDKVDFHARFSKRAPEQHLGAWWELYLHRLFSLLGWQVAVHPDIEGSRRHPDFRLTAPGRSLLVEAAVCFSGIVDTSRNHRLDDHVTAAINAVPSPDFWLGLKIRTSGRSTPARRRISEPLRRWLQEDLDADRVALLSPSDYPVLPLAFEGWRLEIRAIPKSPKARGRTDASTLAYGPASGGFVNDIEALRSTLDRKRARYGAPAQPLVIAVLLVSSSFDDESVGQALFGQIAWRFDPEVLGSGEWVRQRNGFWIDGSRPRGTRISAVLVGPAIFPWAVGQRWPRLWHNPNAVHPVDMRGAFPEAVVTGSGEMSVTDRAELPHQLFQLPADWPGPGDPFAGD